MDLEAVKLMFTPEVTVETADDLGNMTRVRIMHTYHAVSNLPIRKIFYAYIDNSTNKIYASRDMD